MRKSRISLLCTMIAMPVLFFLLFHEGYTQEDGRRVMTLPAERQTTEEEKYLFAEQQYNPPFEIQLISDRRNTSKATPEDVLIAYLSAILKSDSQWMLDLLGESDRKIFENKTVEEQEKEITSQKRRLETLLEGNRIVLEKKITANSHVVINYAAFDRESGKRLSTLFASFVQEKSVWKKCLKCGSTDSSPPFKAIMRDK